MGKRSRGASAVFIVVAIAIGAVGPATAGGNKDVPARATVGDLGVRSDGRGDYIDRNGGESVQFSRFSGWTDADGFSIQTDEKGRIPRSLVVDAPDAGVLSRTCTTANFVVSSRTTPLWRDIPVGTSTLGRASLWCYTGSGTDMVVVHWGASPGGRIDCVVITRLSETRFSFSSATCSASVQDVGRNRSTTTYTQVSFGVTADSDQTLGTLTL